MYLFYLDLLTDLFHMLVYLAFFVLICTYYGLPLHIMRDLYLTCRSFQTRVTDFIRYRRVTHNMQVRHAHADRAPTPDTHRPQAGLLLTRLSRAALDRRPSRTRRRRSSMRQIASVSSAASP